MIQQTNAVVALWKSLLLERGRRRERGERGGEGGRKEVGGGYSRGCYVSQQPIR